MSLPEQTLAIAVIGVAGSGKSTFTNLASGSALPVSDSPKSCTTKLESSTFSLDGRTITLIDTPGFDESAPSVLDVLKLISDHFSGLYSKGVKLAGVIYMHYIADDRTGPSKHNFQIFRKFCGDSTLRDVLIVSNKWPNICNALARECTHKDEFFRPAVDKGARMLCHDGSQASAHAILRHLINRELTVPSVTETASDQELDPTHATANANANADAARELAGQVVHHTKAFGELCHGIDEATRTQDGGTKEVLREKAKDSLEKIERIRYDLEQMVTTLASEKSRLEDENRRFKQDFAAQKAETELRARMLDEERKARELAEAGRGRAELQLAEERALRERPKIEGERRWERASPKLQYDKLFVSGALVFALICMSRFVFDGLTP